MSVKPRVDAHASDLLAPRVPVAHPRLLMQVAAQRGVSASALLSAAGVAPSALEADDGLMFASEYAALIMQAMALTGDPCLGCEFGLSMPPTLHGFLGYALLSASTLDEALELGVKYARLGSKFMNVQAHRTDQGVVLTLQERMPLGVMQQYAMESTMLAWHHAAQHLVGLDAAPIQGRLSFSWPEPEAFARYKDRLPQVVFRAPANQIFVRDEDLRRPLVLGHPLASTHARSLCDSELAQIMSSDETFVARVSESLGLADEGYPSMGQVASRLNLSTRTLMRRLDKLGVSFRQLQEERRRLEAQHLLAQRHLPIEEIAARLGYNNPANFTRAFKRWTGEVPSAYRARCAQP